METLVSFQLESSVLSLDEILDKMDQRGESLRSMSATIVQRKWTDILEEFDQGERGKLHFLKEKKKIYLRKDITDPVKSTLLINDGKVVVYQPRIEQARRYDLGQRKDRAEFLLLGFISDRDALQEAYSIRLLGKENIDHGEAYALELTPRSTQLSAYFSKIVLWIDWELWVPIQQRLVEPTGDYLLFQFKDVQLNIRMQSSRFELKLPPNVQVLQF